MRTVGMVVMSVVAACGGDSKTPDAAVVHDAAADATHADAPPWQPPGMSKTHTVFLQLEGASVTIGADDATMDKSSVAMTAGTLKPWRMGDASRTTELASLVTEIGGIVAPYNITLVTTRPASGTYHEVIVTDDNATPLGLNAGIGAITPAGATCNTEAAPLSFVFVGAYFTSTYSQAMADFITSATISMVGVQGGVPLSKKTNDCMCLAAANCGQGSGTCTIGAAGTPVDSTVACGDPDATMNEAAVFLAVFGAH